MHYPVWIDLKGQDSVPDTVHHVVCMVDPRRETFWKTMPNHWETDGVHKGDRINTNQPSKGNLYIYFQPSGYPMERV